MARSRTANPEAYLAYAKGPFLWNRRTEQDMQKAIGYFQEAIEKDHDYALAYDGMADCWVALGGMPTFPLRRHSHTPKKR